MKVCFGVCFGLLAVVVALNTYFAWYQSRSFFVMPYEWYDLPLAVTRVYTYHTGISLSPWSDSPGWRYATRNDTRLPDELVLPHVDWDKECPSRRRPPMPTFDQLSQQVERLVAAQAGKEKSHSQVKVVHVLGDWGQGHPLWYVWKHILDSPTRSYSSSRACAGYYLNDSISSFSPPPMESLGPKESTEMPGFDQCIFQSKFNVEFRLVPRPIIREELPHVRSLLVFGLTFRDLEPLNEPSLWHEDLTIGVFLITGENCLNGERRRLSEIHERLRFAFLSYGDCYLVNNVDTFLWPLGIALGDGFPNNFNPEYNPPAESRPLLSTSLPRSRGESRPACSRISPPTRNATLELVLSAFFNRRVRATRSWISWTPYAPVLWIKDDWRSELSEVLDRYRGRT